MLGFSVTGCPAGEGRLDVDGILGELGKHRKDPNLILELWTPFSGTIEETISIEEEWAAKSVRFLMKYQTEDH